MDADAFAFHAAEPGHLTFGELVDGCGELDAHFLQGKFADYVLRNELVFKTIVDEVFGWDRLVVRRECRVGAVDQSADFLDHAFLNSGVEPAVDSGVPFVAGHQCADVICVLRQV